MKSCKSNNAEKMFEIQFVHLLNFVKLKCTVKHTEYTFSQCFLVVFHNKRLNGQG